MEDRIYHDEELRMCRECLYVICDTRGCYRATVKAAIASVRGSVTGLLHDDDKALEE